MGAKSCRNRLSSPQCRENANPNRVCIPPLASAGMIQIKQFRESAEISVVPFFLRRPLKLVRRTHRAGHRWTPPMGLYSFRYHPSSLYPSLADARSETRFDKIGCYANRAGAVDRSGRGGDGDMRGCAQRGSLDLRIPSLPSFNGRGSILSLRHRKRR